MQAPPFQISLAGALMLMGLAGLVLAMLLDRPEVFYGFAAVMFISSIFHNAYRLLKAEIDPLLPEQFAETALRGVLGTAGAIMWTIFLANVSPENRAAFWFGIGLAVVGATSLVTRILIRRRGMAVEDNP